ncbi:TolC family outer membrane protein [Oceanicaulis sp. LC35]|uniref:TolC family outer membrane protein n=1 Tax=Oceanicaulis sp. LC35 TaxID=3349635 RepID=UPI003F8480EC
MKRFLCAAALSVLSAGLAPLGLAQAQSLTETLVAAYESNPRLGAQRASLRQSEEGYFQARAGLLPSLSASGSVGETVETWGGAQESDSSSYGLTLNQSLYRGGRTRGNIDASLARIEAARQQLRSTEQSVLLDAVSAHMNVVRDQQVVAIRSNNVEVLAEQLRAARDRFEVGEITRTDVAQAEARLSGARAQLSAAQAALAASRAGYAAVTGVEPVEPVNTGPAEQAPEEFADAAEVAINSNPDLLAAQYSEQAAEYAVRVARGAQLPEVGLRASVSEGRESDFSGQGRGSASITANVTMPIFTGGLNQSSVRQARAAADQARLSGLTIRRQVIEGATNAWNNYLAALAVIESSREAVRANEIAFEGVEQEALVGLRTTLDVLNAEQELLNSRLELVRAERDLTVASYALLQAMGQLDAQSLGLPVDAEDVRSRFEQSRGTNFDLTPWN